MICFFFNSYCHHHYLHSFPTRRSSDLIEPPARAGTDFVFGRKILRSIEGVPESVGVFLDRKSTRLNSSHTVISYAVFCLKKKKYYYTSECHEDYSDFTRIDTIIHAIET